MKKIYVIFYDHYSDMSKSELCMPVIANGDLSARNKFVSKMEGSEYNYKWLEIKRVEFLCTVGLGNKGLELKQTNTFELAIEDLTE